ncbi:MAG: adenylate/guanylate cyclase domain-containing protein [Spirochaetae bacterium HGW-Spirochaetae-7]|nr:MAG: adenylate/guanylate cyclase domain-containing protein [Spirochaetae bacterium HGW-Spirochaetae-7]
MKIRAKIVLLVLPLLIAPLAISGLVSSYSARNGITQVAVQFLRFKAEEIRKYAAQQWAILQENNLSGDDYFVDVARKAVEGYASGTVRGPTELVVGFEPSGVIGMGSSKLEPVPSETEAIVAMIGAGREGWVRVRLGGFDRVAEAMFLPDFGWYVLVSEREDRFYQAVDEILKRNTLIIVVSAFMAALLLGWFSSYMTNPIRNLERTMARVMETNNLGLRAEIKYSDEIGHLAASFNGMASALSEAYGQIKSYALKAALSQRQERKVRNIFQKYVPVSVIEQFFSRPEAQLSGDERILTVLFSDIVGFTGISEQLTPTEVVDSLNHYFERMVEIITGSKGIVDKYIGDAIMAFFGAPVSSGHDALDGVTAALEMLESLDEFNRWQASKGRLPFHSGIGLNHGKVTIGNIGSDKKMDYTVIGDMVNIASRIEGLTRRYDEPLLVSFPVYLEVRSRFPCQYIDKVAVKGRRSAVSIFGVRREIDAVRGKALKIYHAGIRRYYDRRFEEAGRDFGTALSMQPDDKAMATFARRCSAFIKDPPPSGWTGVVVMCEK